MDLNLPEFWRCSTCTYANNPWGLVECEMCGATVRKEAKRPPEDAAPPTAASKLAKQAKGAPVVGLMGTSCPTAKSNPTVPEEGSGVRLQKGSDNQHVVGGEGACGKAREWRGARHSPRPPL